nr:hypothetical protein GCM10020241_58340 [Streptoalloteichus tenebrarius]
MGGLPVIQFVTAGMVAMLLVGLVFAMARPAPTQPVGTPSSLPRHALRPHGGGVPASDLLRRHRWNRPHRTSHARNPDTPETSAETQRLIERTLDRLHRLGPTPTLGSDPEATTPLPVLREG